MKARTKSPEVEYAELKAALITRGYTLRSFALKHGYSIPTTYCAARRLRAGVESTRIRTHLEKLLNE